ncbi:uncharacterized protein LOC143040187 [Oratosquilla oratoria]|uniref:uncharacterized protein LOC143040187 n=1 Tax=Oratosquilla oratoria TaxID=337810 RepID=UPI003F7762EF
MEWDPSYMNWQPQCQSWLHHQQINNMIGQREWKPSTVSHSLSTTEVKREQQQQHAGHSGIANDNGRFANHMPQNSNSLGIRPAELRTDHPNVMHPHHPMYALPVGQHPPPIGQRWTLPEERQASTFCPNFYTDHQQHQSPCLHDRKSAVLPQVVESRSRWPTRSAEPPSFHHQDQMPTQFYLLSTEPHNRRETKPQPVPLNGTGPPIDSSASSSVSYTISPNSELKSATPNLEISGDEQEGNRSISTDGCVVCGDRASGIYYSVRSCQGCKGFFKRVSSNQLTFTCANKYMCKVTRTTRTKCPACRYHACIRAGMTREGRRRTPIKTRKPAAQPLTPNPQQAEMQLTEKGPRNA